MPDLSRILILVAALAASLTTPAAAQDRIILHATDRGEVSEFPAQVIAWSRDQVVYESNGRQREIAASRVDRILFPRSAEHLDADDLFTSRQFDQAALKYAAAIQAELRPWVRELLQARLVQCADATGNIEAALAQFVALYREFPQTRFTHLVPLAWTPGARARGLLATELQRGLTDSDPPPDPLIRLLAASWLLNDDEARAMQVLKRLQTDGEPWMAHLATAQSWRTQLLTVQPSELDRWKAAIDRMPRPLSAGPRLLTGLAEKKLQPGEDAVIQLMQIPILFPDAVQLAGEALSQASDLLDDLGRDDEATIVARELDERYGSSRAALRRGSRQQD